MNDGEKIKYNVHEHWLLSYKVGLAIDIIPEKGGQCSFYLQTSEKSRQNVTFTTKNEGSFDTTIYRRGETDMELKLLIVEDDRLLAEAVSDYFS